MRALNAAKMERMFAKPFVAALDGHIDAVEVFARKPHVLDIAATSASWMEVRLITAYSICIKLM